MILEILCTWVYISIENGFDSLVCIMIPERYIRNTTDQSDILNKGLYESATTLCVYIFHFTHRWFDL